MDVAKEEIGTPKNNIEEVDIERIIVLDDRRELRNVEKLAESIDKIGLISPIAIEEDGTLIAGYHRLEACKLLGWTRIPAIVFDRDDIDIELIEVDENLQRNELNAIERAEALSWRKALYEAKYPQTKWGGLERFRKNDSDDGDSGSGPSVRIAHLGNEDSNPASSEKNAYLEDDNPAPAPSVRIAHLGNEDSDPASSEKNAHLKTSSKEDEEKEPTVPSFVNATAEKTNLHRTTIQRDLQIGENIPREIRDKIRETPLADKKYELLRLAKLDEETQRRVADKIAAGATSVGQVLKEEERQRKAQEALTLTTTAKIKKQNALHFLLDIPAGSVDLLITDPPSKKNVDDIEKFASSWVHLALSRVKATGRAFIFVNAYPQELQAYLNVLLDGHNLSLAQVLVWQYKPIGPKPSHGYKLDWQAIFYLHGPDVPPINCDDRQEQMTIQSFSAPIDCLERKRHTEQKPDELAERLIRQTTKKDGLVIDPFAGTGTFLHAAARRGRRAIGCDNDEEMFNIALERGCVDAA
ncbi:MAG: DNA modification methylase [Deltaproteobacteria bacterium]|nr:DNA modification methylase [Deltaproteobacteria bacterium]